ncbi:MAG: peptidase, partial [Brevundimonas sp.]
RAAQLVGHAVKSVRENIAPSLEAEAVDVSATVLMGGQVAGGALGLYLIYSQGNFIECGADTPYMQIGEFKYGKPILDRALNTGTPLSDAVKLGLISFDSTVRSNVAVGPPFDLITLSRDALKSEQRRIEAEDPYVRELGARWSQAISDAHHAMPAPPWLTTGSSDAPAKP